MTRYPADEAYDLGELYRASVRVTTPRTKIARHLPRCTEDACVKKCRAGQEVPVEFTQQVRYLAGPIERAKRHALRLLRRAFGRSCHYRVKRTTRDRKAEREAERVRVAMAAPLVGRRR